MKFQASLRRLPIALGFVSIFIMSSALTGCQESQSATKPANQIAEVGVISISPQTVTLSTELSGRTTAYTVAQIRPQVSGIVKKRVFKEGAFVKAGDLLYQIDPSSYQATYDSAKASVAKAQATLNAAQLKAKRQSELLAIEAISQQDNEDADVAMKQAVADLGTAKAALETAKINLGYTQITSPISGRVETSSVTQGALVTADQTTVLTTVQQLDPIYVDITQSSEDVIKLRKALAAGLLKNDGADSASIKLMLEDGSEYGHAGSLQFSGVTVDTTTGAVTLRALVPNSERFLMPGMYVRAKLDQGTDHNAILVPQQGINRDGAGRPTALVVKSDGVVELRNVKVAETIGQYWRVTEGLSSGDRVIVEGSAKVKPGQVVKAMLVDVNKPTTTAVAPNKANAPMSAASKHAG